MSFRMIIILVLVTLLDSCFTASVFSLPNRATEAANRRQDYIAAAALPVAVVADVATAPVQIGAIGAYSMAKAVTRPKEQEDVQPEDHARPTEDKGKK